MRGNPWIRILLVSLGVVFMGFPVWRLTQARGPTPVSISPKNLNTSVLTVTVIFAHPPTSFVLSNDGKPLLSSLGSGTEFHTLWSPVLPREGIDLLLKATWPNATPHTAVEVKVEDSGIILTDQTFWGTASLTELVTVSAR